MPKPRRLEAARFAGAGVIASIAIAVALVGVTLASLHIGTARAELKLLPPEEAFRFAGRALDTRTLEANFTIAEGYYLYRDKLRFSIDATSAALGPAPLPPGKLKDDEFFGRVETYRDRLVVRLPLAEAAPGKSLTLRADSQGCADAGVCYPPNVQSITLTVPATDGRPGPLIEATPAKKRWFN
jgi:thiol:disulfide interchange protein DsbD